MSLIFPLIPRERGSFLGASSNKITLKILKNIIRLTYSQYYAQFIKIIFFRVIIILCSEMINRYVGCPRYDRGPQVFQTCAMTTSANSPMYRSLPMCHNDFIMNVLVEKSLLKLLWGQWGSRIPLNGFADHDMTVLTTAQIYKNLSLYFFQA